MNRQRWHKIPQWMTVCIWALLLCNGARMLSWGEKPMCVRSDQIYRNTQEVWLSAENRCIHYKIWTQAGKPGKKVIVWQNVQPEQ